MRRLLSLVLLLSVPAWAEPVYPPGSAIGLEPPAGLQPATRFSGFASPDGASIVITEMPPEAYAQVSAGFTAEAMAGRGITGATREEVTIRDQPALLITAQQAGRPVLMLLARGGPTTALVTARPAAGRDTAPLRAALLDIAFRTPPTLEDKLAAMPFRVGELAGFRPVLTLLGNTALLTRGPADPPNAAGQPMLSLAASFGRPPLPEEQDSFARRLVAALPNLSDLAIGEATEVTRAGQRWHEITATAMQSGPAAGPVTILQAVRFGPEGYLRVILITSEAGAEQIVADARRVIGGLEMK